MRWATRSGGRFDSSILSSLSFLVPSSFTCIRLSAFRSGRRLSPHVFINSRMARSSDGIGNSVCWLASTVENSVRRVPSLTELRRACDTRHSVECLRGASWIRFFEPGWMIVTEISIDFLKEAWRWRQRKTERRRFSEKSFLLLKALLST